MTQTKQVDKNITEYTNFRLGIFRSV